MRKRPTRTYIKIRNRSWLSEMGTTKRKIPELMSIFIVCIPVLSFQQNKHTEEKKTVNGIISTINNNKTDHSNDNKSSSTRNGNRINLDFNRGKKKQHWTQIHNNRKIPLDAHAKLDGISSLFFCSAILSQIYSIWKITHFVQSNLF